MYSVSSATDKKDKDKDKVEVDSIKHLNCLNSPSNKVNVYLSNKTIDIRGQNEIENKLELESELLNSKTNTLSNLIYKMVFNLKRKLIHWSKNQISKSQLFVLKHTHMYFLIMKKVEQLKRIALKTWFLYSKNKMLIKKSAIYRNIDLDIIKNQSVITYELDKEEKSKDHSISILKMILFGVNASINIKVFDDKDKDKEGESNSNINNNIVDVRCLLINLPENPNNRLVLQAKNYILFKFIIKRNYYEKSKSFRKWKNTEWKYQSFEELINRYYFLVEQRENVEIQHKQHKYNFQKILFEEESIKRSHCESCNKFLNNEEVDYLSVNIDNIKNNIVNTEENYFSSVNINSKNIKELEYLHEKENDTANFFNKKANSLLSNYKNNNESNDEEKFYTPNKLISKEKLDLNNQFSSSNFSVTKKIEFGMNGTQRIDFSNKLDLMKNDQDQKSKIEGMEKRIRLLNEKLNKTLFVNGELMKKKLVVEELISK